jgi:GNAT superfamily N-acetyltransferase
MIKDTEIVSGSSTFSRPQSDNNTANLSRIKTIDTSMGTLILQTCCPPVLLESLRADSGLRAFARLPEYEHQLLLDIAKRPDCTLTLAYTPAGQIIGQVTIAPCEGWWSGLESTHEIAIEISSGWRKLGIARQLLDFALELVSLEEMILMAIGFSWHWDTEGIGLHPSLYRQLIKRIFAPCGFAEYLTTEPNISMDPTNILLVRIGNQINQQVVNQFVNRLLDTSDILRAF